jgi:hypothetical protein
MINSWNLENNKDYEVQSRYIVINENDIFMSNNSGCRICVFLRWNNDYIL